MKLPVPFEFAGKTYAEAELRRPTGGLLADTRKAADRQEIYEALITFVAGCTESLDGQADRAQLRVLAREMPYPSAEYLAIQALVLAGVDDDIEGVYECPRCHHKVTVEAGGEDRISNLDLRVAPAPVVVQHHLEAPVVIVGRDEEELFRLESIELTPPTLGALSRAYGKYGFADQIRLQFAAYVESAVRVNGQAPEPRWRTVWGMMAFERMDSADVNAITRSLRSLGLDNTVSRMCPRCGKEWRAEVDTAGFFASGLRRQS